MSKKKKEKENKASGVEGIKTVVSPVKLVRKTNPSAEPEEESVLVAPTPPVAKSKKAVSAKGSKKPVAAKKATEKKKPAAKKSAGKKPQPASVEGGITNDEIARRAYFIAEARWARGEWGDEHGDWVLAERQLREEAKKASGK